MPYKDPEAKRRRDASYRRDRRAELAAKQRHYYQRNRESSDARNAAWIEANPDVARAISFANTSNKRARVFGNAELLFGRDVKAITGPCRYCGGEAGGWDHVIPLSRGGRNHVSNLVACCIGCNKSKHNRTPEEWRTR